MWIVFVFARTCCRICEKVTVLWKNSTSPRTQITYILLFHTQTHWSFLLLILYHHLQLKCFPIYISYSVTNFHVSLAYRSWKKDNSTGRIVKLLPHIFPPESDDLSCVLNRPKHDKSDYEWNILRSEKCSHQIMHCANHDRNMIILIMTETTSRGSFNHDQMKHVQNGGWMRRKDEWPKDPKLGANFLVEIWADEEIQKSKKLRLNPQRMNAAATVISSPILHLTFVKFMQV